VGSPPFEPRNGTPSLEEDPALALSHRSKMRILGAILLALFLAALDQTIVGTALPRIVTDLGGNDLYTWVVTIYLLTSTITVPFYGKLSDLYGRRPLLLFGISVFLIGSALSGLSQEMWQLILFRGIQGVGAGSLFPIALAVIGDLFTPAERGKYQGLFGAVFGISFIIGPALGGFLTDKVSWHWVFYVNIPIGIVSLYVIARLLPTVRRTGSRANLDYLGALVFTVAISFLLVGLTNKQSGGWTDPTVGGFIAIGLALAALFVFVESRASEPIVPLDLWRNRTYASASVATFFVSFGFLASIIFLPRWFQVARGESAMASGYLIFPLLIGLIASSIISGQLVARTGRYKPILLGGIALMAIGLALMSQLRVDVQLPVLFAWMLVTGIGLGPTMAVFTIVIQNAVPLSRLGVATSNLTFFRQIGGSVGLAIAGTVFGTTLVDRLPGQLQPAVSQAVAALPAEVREQGAQAIAAGVGAIDPNDLTGVGQSFGEAILAQVPAELQAALQPSVGAFDAAFSNTLSLAIAQTFVLGVLAAGLALGATVLMRELPLRRGRATEVELSGDKAETPVLRSAPAAD
jgi:EmrB/QacA subfamily drug resistance transporter